MVDPAADDPHRPDTEAPPAKKRWVPLESDPTVLTQYARSLGLSPSLSFQDVYSISDPSLLSFIPRPSYALLLVFPVTSTYEQYRINEDKGKQLYMGHSSDMEEVQDPLKGLMWWRQTIGNACGTMGVLHAVSNGDVVGFIEPRSTFDEIITASRSLDTPSRARFLESCTALEAAHTTFSEHGQSHAPAAEEQVEVHYVALVKHNNHIWELDGRRLGPVDRGLLGEEEDLLGERAIGLAQGFIDREAESGKLNFSLCSLGPSFS